MQEKSEALKLRDRIKVWAMALPDDGTANLTIELTKAQAQHLADVLKQHDDLIGEHLQRREDLLGLQRQVHAAKADHAVRMARAEGRWHWACLYLIYLCWAVGLRDLFEPYALALAPIIRGLLH